MALLVELPLRRKSWSMARSKVLCRTCGKRYIPPSAVKARSWKCSKCKKPQQRLARQKKWDKGERPVCKKHPNRVVDRNEWIRNGKRKCTHCRNRRADGSRKKAYWRYMEKYF